MKNVLLMVGGNWHPFGSCGEILKRDLEGLGSFAVEITEDAKKLTRLSKYDAVVFYTQGGKLTPKQEERLLEFVKGGGGVLGIHCAADSFTENEGYMEMIGTQFAGHGPMADVTVMLSEDADEIVPRVSKQFTIFDEFYLLKRRTKARLRAFMEGWWQFDRKLMSYVRGYGKGRVFYTGLGHDERAFEHPDFQDLILKGLRYVMKMEEPTPVRWGIVGYGPLYGMGGHHAQMVKRTHGFELTAVCDRDPKRLEAAKEEQGEELALFSDLNEMAASGLVDGAIVIVPHNVHAACVKPLLEAGLHVICEKPFAVTVAECDEMIALAEEKGVMLSVYQSRHWDADIVTLRELVESGVIGEVFSIEVNSAGFRRPGQQWRSHKAISGGTMYDMGAHYFEKIFQLVPKVDAAGNPINRKALLFGNFMKKVWHDVTNEDYCRAYVKFDSGLEAQVLQSNICAAARSHWVICGTKGGVTWGADGPVVTTIGSDGRHYTTNVPQVQDTDWWSYYKNVADHLRAGVPLIITAGLGRAVIQCLEGCETAAKENRLVEAEFDLG